MQQEAARERKAPIVAAGCCCCCGHKHGGVQLDEIEKMEEADADDY
jgi:transposase